MSPVGPRRRKAEKYLHQSWRSGMYANFGPNEVALRNRLGQFLNVAPEKIVTTSNATLALSGASLQSPLDKFRVPSFTFPASPMALIYAQKSVRFADISAHDWWIEHSTDLSEGSLAVAPFGSPLDFSRFDPESEVIFDAAASIGSEPDLSGLSKSWAVVFSMHATKVLGAGELGVAVFGSQERAKACRAWTNFGFNGSRESQHIGVNAKVSEIQAAFALSALDGWHREKRDWLRARAKVRRLEEEYKVTAMQLKNAAITPYWIVEFDSQSKRDAAEQILAKKSISSRRWWSDGCHRMKAFEGIGFTDLSNTEAVCDTTLGLPFFRRISTSQLARIESALQEAAG